MLTMTAAERTFLETATEREVVVRLEILDRATGSLVLVIDSREESDVRLLPGGTQRTDTEAECLRTASFSIVDPNSQVTVGVDGVVGLDKVFKLYKGYYIPATGAYSLWPLGVYLLSGEPRLTPENGVRIIQLQLADKSSMANGRPRGGFKDAIRVTAGMTKNAAITAIAGVETWQETSLNLWQGSTATLPIDYPWEDTATPWEAVLKVNELVETGDIITRLEFDPYGRLTTKTDPGPDLGKLPAVWRAQVNEDGLSLLVRAEKALDLFRMPNAVQVRWGSELITPGVAWSVDRDANSSTSVDKIGWLIWRWKNGAADPLIRNLAEGQARADYERRNRRAFGEKVPFSMVECPPLEPWDVVNIYEPAADVNGNYQVLSYTISLDENLEMQCEGWQVRRLG